MRHILEEALNALVNDEQDVAIDKLHEFIVGRARQIHESYRSGDDFVLNESWEEQIEETYFTEADLADLEDDSADVSFDAPAADGEEGEEDLGGEDLGGEEDEAGEVVADESEVDFGADVDADIEDEVAVEDEGFEGLDELEAKIDDLSAKFDEIMGALSGEDFADEEAEEVEAPVEDEAESEEGDFDAEDAGEVDADAVSDDMTDGDEEDGDDADFDDIKESVLSELEKVEIKLADGKDLIGGAVQQQKTSPVVVKAKDARQAGKPVEIKDTPHKGFEREAGPAVAAPKARKNIQAKANSEQSKVAAPKAAKEVGSVKSALPKKK